MEDTRNAIAVLSRCAFISAESIQPWDAFVVRWALDTLAPFASRKSEILKRIKT